MLGKGQGPFGSNTLGIHVYLLMQRDLIVKQSQYEIMLFNCLIQWFPTSLGKTWTYTQTHHTP